MIFFIDSIVYICSKALGVKNNLYQFFYLIVSSKDIDSDANYISKMVFVKVKFYKNINYKIIIIN